MAKLSNYGENKVVNHLLRNTAIAVPTLYIALHSADPGETGANELSGGGYLRTLAGSFDAAASRANANSSEIRFPALTAELADATHFSIWDAQLNGNMWFYGSALSAAVAMEVGSVPVFEAGAIAATITGEISTYAANKMLDHIFGVATYTTPGTSIYTSLHTADPGLTGASEVSFGFDSYSGTDLSINTASKITGANSFAINITDTSARYGQLTVAGDPQTVVAAAKIRVSELTMANNDSFRSVVGYNSGGNVLFAIEPKYTTASGFQVFARITRDALTEASTSSYALADGDEAKVVWTISTGPGANDGSLKLYINNVLKETLSAIDNDTFIIDKLRIGAVVGLDAGTSGNLYMDDIWWNTTDDSTTAQDYLTFEGISDLSTYARVQVTAWDSPTDGATANTSDITYPTPTPSSFGTITHKGIWDAASGGNFLIAANLDSSLVTSAGTAPVDGAGDFDVVVQ